MKIELEFKDLEEFSEFVSGLNNAVLAYNQIIKSIQLGCSIPSIFEKLAENKTEEELNNRLNLLINKYKELEKIEEYYLDPLIWKNLHKKISFN